MTPLTIPAAVNACQRAVSTAADTPKAALTSGNTRTRPDCQRVSAPGRPPPPSRPEPVPKPTRSDPRRHILPTGPTGPTEIDALRRSRRATRTPMASRASRPRPNPPDVGKASSVETRLRRTLPENRDTLAILATVLQIRPASRACSGRSLSTSDRIDIDTVSRTTPDGDR